MASVNAAAPGVSAPRSIWGWPRCIALTTLLVGFADFIQSYLLFAVAGHRPAIGVLQAPRLVFSGAQRCKAAHGRPYWGPRSTSPSHLPGRLPSLLSIAISPHYESERELYRAFLAVRR